MLWDLAHADNLSLYLLNQAVQSHLDILTESNTVRSNTRTEYVSKCVEDVKQAKWVVPAIRHMLKNFEFLAKAPFGKNNRVRSASEFYNFTMNDCDFLTLYGLVKVYMY